MKQLITIHKICDSYCSAICGSKIDKVCKLQDNLVSMAENSQSLFCTVLIASLAIIVPTILCAWVAVSTGPLKVFAICTEPIFLINLLLEATDTNIDSKK